MYIWAYVSAHTWKYRKWTSEAIWRVRVFFAFNLLVPSLFSVQEPCGDTGDNTKVASGPHLYRKTMFVQVCALDYSQCHLLMVSSLKTCSDCLIITGGSCDELFLLYQYYLSIALLINWFLNKVYVVFHHTLGAEARAWGLTHAPHLSHSTGPEQSVLIKTHGFPLQLMGWAVLGKAGFYTWLIDHECFW